MEKSSNTNKYIMFSSGGLQFFLPIDKVERIASSKEQIEELDIIDFNSLIWRKEACLDTDIHRRVLLHNIIIRVDNKRFGLLVETVSAIKVVTEERCIPFCAPAKNERNCYLEYVVYQQDEVPSLIYIVEPIILYKKILGE